MKMKTNDICRKIFEINGSLERVMENLVAAKDNLITKNSTEYERKLLRGIYLLENTTLRVREIANSCFQSTNPTLYGKMMKNLGNKIYNFTLERSGNVLRLTLPCLLPHYKENNKNIITEPLNRFLRAYRKEVSDLPQYDSVVILVINHVGQAGKGKIRDNDNYEYKQLINTLSYWFLSDDNYHNCRMMSCTKISDNEMTEVFIIPTKEFGKWYIENEAKLF